MPSGISLPPAFAKHELFLNNLTMMTDSFACWDDNFFVIADFSMEPSYPFLANFCDSNILIVLTKSNTFMGIGSCIDLILAKKNTLLKILEHLKQVIVTTIIFIYTMV